MQSAPFPDSPPGAGLPRLGQGTWYLGENERTRAEEVAALRLGIDLGIRLIDTAEMYGDGAAEELVGQAIAGLRDEVFLVDKVLPTNADRKGTIRACHESLRRLGTDRIDLYLLHWPGPHPLEETVEAFGELVAAGDIGQWGVSNFDTFDIEDLISIGGVEACATNQVLYNPTRRGIEYDLLPLCRSRAISVMAYSPLEQGSLLQHRVISEIAGRHIASPAQIVLAWVLRHNDVTAIPRSGNPMHVRDNAAALNIALGAADLDAIDTAFPAPSGPRPLEVL